MNNVTQYIRHQRAQAQGIAVGPEGRPSAYKQERARKREGAPADPWASMPRAICRCTT